MRKDDSAWQEFLIRFDPLCQILVPGPEMRVNA
jgi:hypothetical protein